MGITTFEVQKISARLRDLASRKSVFFKKFLHVCVFSCEVLRDALVLYGSS